MQRNSLHVQEQKFLTSGVNAHLGGLGGKLTVASDSILPLIPFSTFSPYWYGGRKRGRILSI